MVTMEALWFMDKLEQVINLFQFDLSVNEQMSGVVRACIACNKSLCYIKQSIFA